MGTMGKMVSPNANSSNNNNSHPGNNRRLVQHRIRHPCHSLDSNPMVRLQAMVRLSTVQRLGHSRNRWIWTS